MVVFSVLACKLGGGSFANWVAAVLQIIMTFSNSIKPFAICHLLAFKWGGRSFAISNYNDYWLANGVAGASPIRIGIRISTEVGQVGSGRYWGIGGEL